MPLRTTDWWLRFLFKIGVVLSWMLLAASCGNRFIADGFGSVHQTRTRSLRNVVHDANHPKSFRMYPEKKQGNGRRRVRTNTNNFTATFNKWLQQVAKQNPERAEAALRDEMVTTMDCDTLSFNIVLNGWAQQRSVYAAKRAQALLTTLLQSPSDRFSADAWSYSAVMNALAKSGGGRNVALQCESLLKQAQATIKLSSDVFHNAVIDAWSLSGARDAGERAEQWLRQLESCNGIGPSRISYNSVLKAWSRSPNGGPRAQMILDKMLKLSHSDARISPDKISFTTTMAAWANSETDHAQAAQRAEELLQRMELMYERSTKNGRSPVDIRPDVKAYTTVLAAYAKSGSKLNGDNENKALDLLQRMKRYAGEQPNSFFCNAWIHWLAKSGQRSSTKQAEMILQMMKESDHLEPCKVTYTAIISVHANQGSLKAAQRAQELLDELENLYTTSRQFRYLPNAKTFAAVLNAWAKSGSTNALPQANALLGRMDKLYQETNSADLKPNKMVYGQVFSILSNCSNDPLEATQRAIELLEQMKFLHKNGLADTQPDATTYAYLVNTFTKAKVENASELATIVLREAEDGYANGEGALKPTCLLYSAVLQAYAKSASREGAELAENLLHRTKELYRQGKMYAKPTVLYYNAVMDAHARSNGGRAAAERAEALLNEMEFKSCAGDAELRLKTRSFNAALLAWTNSNDREAPHRAEVLLRRMNDKYKKGDKDCRPDQVTLNTMIACWEKAASRGSANFTSQNYTAIKRDQAFLNFMETMFCEYGDNVARKRFFQQAQSGCQHMEQQRDNLVQPDALTHESIRSTFHKTIVRSDF